MVVLYAGGKRLGTWAEAEGLLTDAVKLGPVEFRHENGRVFAWTTTQPPEPICPWEPTLTVDELDRRSAAGGGTTLAEFWTRMGVK